MVHKYSYLLFPIALCPHVINYSSELCVIHDLGMLTMNCQLDIGAVVIVRRYRDRMVVGFTTTYEINTYHH